MPRRRSRVLGVLNSITVGIDSVVKGGIKVEKPHNNWLGIHVGKPRPPRVIIGPDAVVDALFFIGLVPLLGLLVLPMVIETKDQPLND